MKKSSRIKSIDAVWNRLVDKNDGVVQRLRTTPTRPFTDRKPHELIATISLKLYTDCEGEYITTGESQIDPSITV